MDYVIIVVMSTPSLNVVIIKLKVDYECSIKNGTFVDPSSTLGASTIFIGEYMFKRGNKVKVVSLKESKRYGINMIMEHMLKSERSYLIQGKRGDAFNLRGYYFHKDDLAHEDVVELKSNIFHFNIATLEGQ